MPPGRMGEPFGRWSSTPSRGEYDDRSPLRRSNSFARPTGKSIYNQRKDYGQTLLKLQSDFQHHVEHLLTLRLERDLRSVEDCLGRLKSLEEQGRVWGQGVVLQVKDQELVLSDVESKEELEAFPLGSVQGCSAGLDNTVLTISVQEWNPPGTSVLLFQCERLGAEALKSSLERMLRQRKEEPRNHYGHSPEMPPAPPYAAQERWAEPPEPEYHPPPQRVLPPQPVLPPQRALPPQRGLLSSDYRAAGHAGDPVVSPDAPDTPQVARTKPPAQVTMSEVDRDVEVLNHVLEDLELFVGQLKMTLSLGSKRKKKQKKNAALPAKDEYTDFFQKVKYALNLLGRTHRHVQNPDPSELLRLIFSALSFVLQHCPSPGLAPGVESPLLLPEALQFLEETLGDDDYGTWKSLGNAWNKSRAEYPNSALVPAYIPVFSDGWLPPVMELQDAPPPASVSPARSQYPSRSLPPAQSAGTGWRDKPAHEFPLPTQGLVRALYDFQARNSRELSVRKGDMLQVLDQQRKWWLVQDERGDRGHVPGNILEPLPEPGHTGGHSATQDSPPSLHPNSSPEEVTAWLTDKGFSRITVRTLGVLRGHELLQMSPDELRGVCPEEWRRLLFKLSPIRTSLGIGPRA